ncbi:DEAD/DEAH box helicase [Azospirillum sp. TSA6c]|uniref:DEAD/DEAH box helicase n=1 Tax=unclassified Azospirillum TaxID=2630922 RepID=UPI000D6428AD|nr:DEAD/DEAH box helicase [Azospirillum sp. TSA6c]
MFDPVTAEIMRGAPALPGLNPAELPQLLTARYAELVARRLRRAEGTEDAGDDAAVEGEWPLARIADAYEIVVSVVRGTDYRRAAAFVAGTAHQILAQDLSQTDAAGAVTIMDRDRIHPAIAAAVLFLISEQYADAHEAARFIRPEEGEQDYVCTILAENIRDLARGKFHSILHRAQRRPAAFVSSGSLEQRGTTALFEGLVVGVELFAAEVLGEDQPDQTARLFGSARAAFARVLDLASSERGVLGELSPDFLTTYPGPRHLASLLLSAYDSIVGAAVTRLPPPEGADGNYWRNWLRHRANAAPFLWPNHREAIAKGFHQNGKSAVLVLPTGAGKTTVSCLKIAAVLASGKSVVFIAPTHALVDQLTVDLQEVFPQSLEGSIVSSDFDRLFASGTNFESIEVMTPERCLALLSYSPEAFENVGLLVFDECHLLSPISNLRRALDGMFCVLAFNSIAPEADFLFLSAMLDNGATFAEWIEELTRRTCIFADPLWKPSRQARGILLYDNAAIERMRRNVITIQRKEDARKRKRAKNLRKPATEALQCQPHALFGLQHNWLSGASASCSLTAISDAPVTLTGDLNQDRSIYLKPNVNKVAAQVAAAAARNGLKGIVFVNRKDTAASTAREISALLGNPPAQTQEEEERWKVLETELGGLEHAILPGPAAAVPHNALMLRLERDLAERLFRRADGAKVIVATPTLAQGLNLPAHIAILAGDKRSDPEEGGREDLKAHEILNAAARAGRAGHLANGIVLLIPEAVLEFRHGQPLPEGVLNKLKSVLPEDDRCLSLSDPLQTILDRVNVSSTADPDVEYALNRLITAVAPEGAEAEATTRFSIRRSLAAFTAIRNNKKAEFEIKIARLNELIGERAKEADDPLLAELATQSGAPLGILKSLRQRIEDHIDGLPQTIPDWMSWIINWLAEDKAARDAILIRDGRAILGATGNKKDGPLTAEAVKSLEPGILAWLRGEPLREIERQLGGDPARQAICPRGRELVSQLIPLSLSFAAGLVARAASESPAAADNPGTPVSVINCLAAGVRRGFDTPSKLAFSDIKRGFLSRVQTHQAYAAIIGYEPDISNTDEYPAVVERIRQYLLLLEN